jgi:LysR family glycine cleavage system transcriptional activator
VALAHRPYVIDDVRAGRLVRPFRESIVGPYNFWLLSLPERADQPAVRRFRAWLTARAEADDVLDIR